LILKNRMKEVVIFVVVMHVLYIRQI